MDNIAEGIKENVNNFKEKAKDIGENLKSNAQNLQNNIKNNIENFKPETKNGNFNITSDFLNSNTLIAKAVFLLLIIIIFSLLFYICSKIIIYFLSPSETPYILYGMKDATTSMTIPQAMSEENAIPIMRSNNQYDGVEFTYAFWMYVSESDYDDDDFKHVFHKGSLKSGDPPGVFGPNNCPGVYLYNGKRNISDNLIDKYPLLGLLVRINVFHDTTNENDPYNFYDDIYVDGIPIKKWVCVILRVTSQNIVDVYINGTLTKRHNLSNVVKQNYDNFYINMRGGFRGNLSNIKYYNYAIGTFEIDSITSNGPNLTMAEDTNISTSAPYYLSSQWYFNDTDPLVVE